MTKDAVKISKLARMMMFFFIVGNILNLVAYNLWKGMDKQAVQITLGVAVLVAILCGLMAYKRIGGVLDYLSYLAISLITSYIPYWLITNYTNGGSYRLYIICGMLYNLITVAAIILSYKEFETGTISIIALTAAILLFSLMVVIKNSGLLASIAGYVPNDTSIWTNEITILAVFNIGIAIIQYVGLLFVKEDSYAPLSLVTSFLLIFGLAVAILLAVITEGNCDSDCGSMSNCDCGSMSNCDCGSSEEDRKKRVSQ